MKKINLIKLKTKDLAEIFQSLDIKFAFVNKKGEEVSVPAKCRDFLGDCIVSKKNKQPSSIYGFSYNYKDTPFDDCRFSLKFPNNQSKTNFINNLNILHEKEKQAGVKRSKIFETQEKNTLVIEGSNFWVSSVWKVSLYTFYLKLISYKDITQLKDPEDAYIKHLTHEKETILLSKIKMKTEYIPTNISKAHNYMGFISLIKGSQGCSETQKNHNLVFGKG